MAVTVLLPSILAAEAQGRQRFQLQADTVAEALRALPVADLLFDEHGRLRPLVNVYVDGRDIREHEGTATPLFPGATVRIVQAVAGG